MLTTLLDWTGSNLVATCGISTVFLAVLDRVSRRS